MTATTESLRSDFAEQLSAQLFWVLVVVAAITVLVFIWAVIRGGRLTYDQQVDFLEGYLGQEREPSAPTEETDGSRRDLS